MVSPINALIDRSARCMRCGAKMGACNCWDKILLRCPHCKRSKPATRERSDPVGAAIVEAACPECDDNGDRPEVHYYDANGRWFNGEKFVEAQQPHLTMQGKE